MGLKHNMTEKKPKGWRYKGDRYTEKKFRPYALAIGQTALAWNDLYEALASLFAIMNGGGNLEKHNAIWNSQTMDRPKRLLLAATIQALTPAEEAQFPKMKEAIKWVVDTTEKLEDARNNTVHLPLLLVHSGGLVGALRSLGQYVPDVIAQTIHEHPRAIKMVQKDILEEFRWCRKAILTVRDFSRHLGRALSSSNAPWPDIPKLPIRPGQNGRLGLRHPREIKRRPRQRQSSRG